MIVKPVTSRTTRIFKVANNLKPEKPVRKILKRLCKSLL